MEDKYVFVQELQIGLSNLYREITNIHPRYSFSHYYPFNLHNKTNYITNHIKRTGYMTLM